MEKLNSEFSNLSFISVEAFFDMDPDGQLQTMMDAAYKETSTRVVEILTKQYHLMDHLQGIKGYLLLGQGHFVQHLMHLIEYGNFLQQNFNYKLTILPYKILIDSFDIS